MLPADIARKSVSFAGKIKHKHPQPVFYTKETDCGCFFIRENDFTKFGIMTNYGSFCIR